MTNDTDEHPPKQPPENATAAKNVDTPAEAKPSEGESPKDGKDEAEKKINDDVASSAAEEPSTAAKDEPNKESPPSDVTEGKSSETKPPTESSTPATATGIDTTSAPKASDEGGDAVVAPRKDAHGETSPKAGGENNSKPSKSSSSSPKPESEGEKMDSVPTDDAAASTKAESKGEKKLADESQDGNLEKVEPVKPSTANKEGEPADSSAQDLKAEPQAKKDTMDVDKEDVSQESKDMDVDAGAAATVAAKVEPSDVSPPETKEEGGGPKIFKGARGEDPPKASLPETKPITRRPSRGKSFSRLSSNGSSTSGSAAAPMEKFHPKRPRRQSQSSQSSGNGPKTNTPSPYVPARSSTKRSKGGQTELAGPLPKSSTMEKRPTKSSMKKQGKSSRTSSPIISPEQYHMKFCVPLKRRRAIHQAQHMQLMAMNQRAMHQDDGGGGGGDGMMNQQGAGAEFAQRGGTNKSPNLKNQGEKSPQQGGGKKKRRRGSSNADDRSPNSNGSGVKSPHDVVAASMIRNKMMNEMMMQRMASHGQPTPKSMGNRSHPSPGSHHSRNSRGSAGGGGGGGFPSMPFGVGARDGGNDGMMDRTRRIFMEAQRRGMVDGGDNNDGRRTMDDRDRQQGMKDEPDSRGSGGTSKFEMVITGVPLKRGSIDTSNHGKAARRRSSSNWSAFGVLANSDNISVGGGSLAGSMMDAISPAPFKDIITKDDFFSRFPGMSPMISDKERISMMNNPEMRDRMMMNMMGGPQGGGGMGFGGSNYGGNNAGENSLLERKRRHSMDLLMEQQMLEQQMMAARGGGGMGMGMGGMQGMMGGGQGMMMEGMHTKSPTPKKSFLQRERVMDAEMRTHMSEALAGFKKNHHRRNSFVDGQSGSHPNSKSGTPHGTFMGDHQQHAQMMENMKNVELPSLTSPNEDDLKPPKKKSKNSSKSDDKKTKKDAAKIAKDEIKKAKKSKQLEKKQAQEALTASILAASVMPDKPKRPFSAYNLFFQLEREFIKEEISQGRTPAEDPIIKDALKRVEEENKKKKEAGEDVKSFADVQSAKSKDSTASEQQQQLKKQPSKDTTEYFSDPNIPDRYAHLLLDKHWYSVGHKQKRKHRKTEGSCGFIELTKMVSARWKSIEHTDPHVKKYCQKLADIELSSYKKDMDMYKRAVKKAELEATTKAMVEQQAGMNEIVKQNTQVAEKSGKKKRESSVEEGGKKKKKTKKDSKSSIKSKTAQDPQQRSSTPEELLQQHTNMMRQQSGFQGHLNQGMMYNEMMNNGMGGGNMGGMGGMGGNDQMMNEQMMAAGGNDFARFSGPFSSSSLAAEMNTPRSEAFLAELCKDDGRVGSSSGSRRSQGGGNGMTGLPPPPFADGRSMSDVRAAEARRMTEARMAKVRMLAGQEEQQSQGASGADGLAAEAVRMAEARMSQFSGAGGRGDGEVRNMGDHGNENIQQKFAALAEAEARHRMQMKMQGGSGMIGGGHGPQQDIHGLGMRDGGNGSPFQRNKAMMMGQDDSHGQGGDRLSSPLRRKFMEQLSQGGGMPGGGSGAGPDGKGGSNGQEQHFDMEVERFLSCLGKEIKEKHRRGLLDSSGDNNFGGEGAGMRAEMMAQMTRASGGGDRNSEMPMGPGMRAEMMAQMTRGSGGGDHNSEMSMGPGMRAEMMARVMRESGGGDGNFGSEGAGMRAEMMSQMMRGSGGGDSNFGSEGAGMRAEMMSHMMRGSGGGDRNFGGDGAGMRAEMMSQMMRGSGGGDHNSEMSMGPGTRAEMMAQMMRGSGGGDPNPEMSMMRNPVSNAASREAMMAEMMMMRGQHNMRGGMSQQQQKNSSGARGGDDDDDPALPEYGWGRGDGPNQTIV